jgi:hypothetical protein
MFVGKREYVTGVWCAHHTHETHTTLCSENMKERDDLDGPNVNTYNIKTDLTEIM